MAEKDNGDVTKAVIISARQNKALELINERKKKSASDLFRDGLDIMIARYISEGIIKENEIA